MSETVGLAEQMRNAHIFFANTCVGGCGDGGHVVDTFGDSRNDRAVIIDNRGRAAAAPDEKRKVFFSSGALLWFSLVSGP